VSVTLRDFVGTWNLQTDRPPTDKLVIDLFRPISCCEGKRHNTNIAPQEETAGAAALYATDSAGE